MERFLAEVERRALRMAQLSVGNTDDALDIVQDAMLRLVRSYATRPAAEWPPLFHRILSNRIRDHHRQGRLRFRFLTWLPGPAEDDDEDILGNLPDPSAPLPEEILQREGALKALEAALGRLPPRQREAFLWRSLEELDVAATAAAMGCSEGSVKTHYFRALRGLRAALADHWGDQRGDPCGDHGADDRPAGASP